MSSAQKNRGGAPVGHIADLEGIEAASVIYLRLWCDGPKAQASMWDDFASSLGSGHADRALKVSEDLFDLCAKHGRRPLMRHAVSCRCVGADEACFANFIATAATGAREDAMLIATLLVRADVAPLVTALATDFGHALMRMTLAAPRHMRPKNAATTIHSHPTTVH